MRPVLGCGGANNTKMKRKKEGKKEPAGQALDYSRLESHELESCEQHLKALAEASGYQAMKKEYLRRLAEIEAEKEKRK